MFLGSSMTSWKPGTSPWCLTSLLTVQVFHAHRSWLLYVFVNILTPATIHPSRLHIPALDEPRFSKLRRHSRFLGEAAARVFYKVLASIKRTVWGVDFYYIAQPSGMLFKTWFLI